MKLTKRNETKREFFDHVENVTNLKIENFIDKFEWLFVNLIIWYKIVIVCNFLKNKYVYENRMLKKNCERQILNHVNFYMNFRW